MPYAKAAAHISDVYIQLTLTSNSTEARSADKQRMLIMTCGQTHFSPRHRQWCERVPKSVPLQVWGSVTAVMSKYRSLFCRPASIDIPNGGVHALYSPWSDEHSKTLPSDPITTKLRRSDEYSLCATVYASTNILAKCPPVLYKRIKWKYFESKCWYPANTMLCSAVASQVTEMDV